MSEKVLHVLDEAAMVRLGEQLGRASAGEGTLYLGGDLGMGKTTLCRGVLRAFGHVGAVKSPTYTLVEPYELAAASVYHFDLYRLADPEELEYVGIRDYFSERSLRLVEWSERGAGVLPEPDLRLEIDRFNSGRSVSLYPVTALGHRIVQRLEAGLQQ